MRFIKYPSLTNHYAISKKRNILSHLDSLWYSSEKIHGTNCVLGVSADDFKVGKRSGWTDEKPWSKLFELLTEDTELLDTVRASFITDDVKYVVMYGELFGAGIQKMDYDVNKNGTIDFKLFNILKVMNDGTYALVSKKTIDENLPEKFVVKTKTIKTLKEFINDELSNVSEYGGEPEGDVYQPAFEYDLLSDTVTGAVQNFLGVKHKREEFGEIKSRPKTPRVVTDTQLKLQLAVLDYVTENRVVNVLSHGDIELAETNFGKLIKLVQEDILKEFTAETPIDLTGLDGELNYAINKSAGEIAKVLKNLMFKNVSGL